MNIQRMKNEKEYIRIFKLLERIDRKMIQSVKLNEEMNYINK